MQRIAASTLLLAVAVTAAAACGGGNAEPGEAGRTTGTSKPATERFEITVADYAPKGGVKALEVTEGARVEIAVTSDKQIEVHVDAYEDKLDVPAGETRELVIEKADITGSFEVHVEEPDSPLARLNVR